jgi:hypothetical protein
MERERAQSLDEAGLVCRRWRAQVRWAHLTGRTGVEQLASEVDARSMEDCRRSHGEQRYDKHMASNMVLQQQKDRRGDGVAWRAASVNKQVANSSSSVQQEQKYGEHLNVVCRRASEGEPVDRKKEDGGGRDQQDDKQVQQQQTGGGRANAAHDERLLYDFPLRRGLQIL